MGLIFTIGSDEQHRSLAERVVAEQHLVDRGLAAAQGPEARARCVETVRLTLMYLDTAQATATPELFLEYVGWLREAPERSCVADSGVDDALIALRRVLERSGSAEAAALVNRSLAAARPAAPPSHLDEAVPLQELAQSYLQALLAGDRREATRLILDAADRDVPVADLYLLVFQPCLREIGRLWQLNHLTVAQEHLCTAATQMVMSQLYPRIFNRPGNGLRLVAVCANGELHEIALRMVADLFEMDGWETTYLGASTPTSAVIRYLVDSPPDLLAVSATITPNVPAVAGLIAAVRAEPALAGLPVLVGGIPFNRAPNLWRQVGADGWAPDARGALAVAQTLVKAP